MAGVQSNLYPCIVQTYMPAFIYTNSCRVYFSLSSYNSYSDVRKYAQISVKNQRTNSSVLNTSLYPSGIMLSDVYEDTDRTTDDKYYIIISSEDIEGGFALNQYYKVQIRFSSTSVASPPYTNITYNNKERKQYKLDNWLASNTEYFSEWSTVCLIRGISQPTITLMNFSEQTANDALTVSFSSIDFIGTVSFDELDEEQLKEYQIKLYDDKGSLLCDSGTLYPTATNELNHTLEYILIDGNSYSINLSITTRNLYTESHTYRFSVIQGGYDQLNADIVATGDEETGSIQISLVAKDTNLFNGNITIRRSSSKTNFTIWEDVHTTILNNGELLNYTWTDYTIESGVWYKYCAQRRNSLGQRGIILSLKEPVMVVFYDMFLIADQKQLRLKYDQQISSFKRTVTESKTDTIGSQYPFIKRNGYVNYRSFPISAIISFKTDDFFYTRADAYGDSAEYYADYNTDARVTDMTDYIYEKNFRDKVMDFLYADNVKLLRTLTEGNILVKLMDINLTPKTELGRYIYTFTANAYEIADCTLDNIDSFNIQPVGDYSHLITYTHSILGQLDQEFSAGTNYDLVKKLAQTKYEKLAASGYVTKVEKFTYLRIEMKSSPYFITSGTDGSLTPKQGNPATTDIYGYIVYINNVPVYMSPEGIYELRGSDINITSVYFPVKTTATVDFVVLVDEEEDVSHLAHLVYYNKKMGQCWGMFSYKDSIFKQIYNRYRLDYTKYYQKLISIDGIKIEADPGTVVWIRDSNDSDLNRHIINETGSLQIYDEDSVIEGLYFGGVHLDEASEYEQTRDTLPYNKFKYTGIVATTTDLITDPILNGVYTIDETLTASAEGVTLKSATDEDEEESPIATDAQYNAIMAQQTSEKNYIYYRGRWYPFTATHDILCDTEALVDYYCEIMKGVYAAS